MICYLHGLTVVTAGVPFGHGFHHADGFFVESGVTATDYFYVFDGTGLRHDEFNDYTTGYIFFGSCCRVLDVVAEPFVHGCFAAGEFRLLLNVGRGVDDIVFLGLFFNNDYFFLHDLFW